MKYFLIFLAILLTALFQSTIWSFNFLMLLVLIFSLILPESWAFFFAFMAGLLLDLFSGNRPGISSLGFLLISFLLIVYRRRFSFQNLFACFIFTFLSYLLFSLFTQKSLNLVEGFFLGIFFVGLRFLIPFIFRVENERQLKLEV